MTPTGNPKPRKAAKKSRSPLQIAGGKFVDELGERAINALKVKLGLNTEEKYKDTLTGPTAMTATASTTAGNTNPVIAQGSTTNTRNGAGIRITSVEYRFTFYTAASTTQANSIRLICCRTIGAAAIAATDLLQVSTDFTSPINNDFFSVGEILMDKVIQLGGQTTSNSSADIIGVIRRPNMHMIWTDADTTGAASNVIEGRMYWYVYYNGSSGTPPLCQNTVRYNFVDN